MSDKKFKATKVIVGATPGKLVRVSHFNCLEARLNSESGNMEFSTQLLIPKENTEDVAAIKAAIENGKKQAWLDEKKKVPPQFWNPLRDGDVDTKQNGDPLGAECKGHYVINVKSGEDSPPNVVGTTRGEDGKFKKLTKADIKSGDWCRVSINLTPYIKGMGGVGAYVSSVQLVKEGEALGNKSSAEDDFGDFEDDADDMMN